MVKVLKQVSKETEMAAKSRSGVQRSLLCSQGLSSKLTRGRFKAGLQNSDVNGLLKQ